VQDDHHKVFGSGSEGEKRVTEKKSKCQGDMPEERSIQQESYNTSNLKKENEDRVLTGTSKKEKLKSALEPTHTTISKLISDSTVEGASRHHETLAKTPVKKGRKGVHRRKQKRLRGRC